MSLSDLITARSQVTIRAEIFTAWDTLGVSLSGLQEDSMLRAGGEVVSQALAEWEGTRVAWLSGGYLQTAETLANQGFLSLLAEDYYQLTLDPATRAEHQFRVTASASASGTTIGTGKAIVRFGSGATQVLFENTEPFTPALGAYVDVPFRAQAAGVSGNIATAQTLALVTAYPGLTVTNPAVSGTSTSITSRGRAAETSISLANRCRRRWADLAFDVVSERFVRVVRDAFAAVGQTNPIEDRVYVDDANPYGPGSVALYLARAGAVATAGDVSTVRDYLTPRWTGAGHGAFTVASAAVYTLTISGTIKGPTNATAALTQADTVLDALAPDYPIGGATVYAEQVRAALLGGVTGALNVTLTLAEETAIPAGSIVDFVIGTLSIVP